MNFGASRLGFWYLGSPFSLNWNTTQTGIEPLCQDGVGGWYITNNGLQIRYVIQDSQNCGGCNPNIQSGTATATINTGSASYYFSYNLNGIGEFQDSGYEQMVLSLTGGTYNNEMLVFATSQDLDLGCSDFGPVIQTIAVPPPILLLPNTQYEFSLNFSTNDPLYHLNCYYECSLNFTRA
jgi:hypothetical protein